MKNKFNIIINKIKKIDLDIFLLIKNKIKIFILKLILFIYKINNILY